MCTITCGACPVPLPQVLHIARDLLAGLASLHQGGLTHGVGTQGCVALAAQQLLAPPPLGAACTCGSARLSNSTAPHCAAQHQPHSLLMTSALIGPRAPRCAPPGHQAGQHLHQLRGPRACSPGHPAGARCHAAARAAQPFRPPCSPGPCPLGLLPPLLSPSLPRLAFTPLPLLHSACLGCSPGVHAG